MAATDQVKDAASGVKDKASDAADGAKGATDGVTGGLRKEILSSFGDVLGPAIKEMSSQSAEKLLAYAKEQGPAIFKEQALPKIMKSAGVDNPEDLAKAGVGKVGQMMSGSGGITGIAGKIMGKIGGRGGRGKGVATGYGQKRRIMVQQDHYIPVNVKDVYRAWTQLEWPQFMHRISTLDRQVGDEEGGESRYAIGVKGFLFKKNFTAQIREQQPFGYIVWNTTQGNLTNTGRVSFIGITDDLTLVVVNLDLAPSGPREKIVRGARYHKRAIRGDLHRFGAKVQMMAQEELDDLEGDLTTIEGNKITQTHDEYMEEHPEEQDRGQDREEDESDEESPQAMAQSTEEDESGDEEESDDQGDEEESDDQDDQEEPESEAAEDEADDEEDEEDRDDEDEPEEDEEDEEEGDDYDDMSLADLRKEARERDLSSRGNRAALIDRLREDDEDERNEDDEPEEDEEPDEKPSRRTGRRRTAARR